MQGSDVLTILGEIFVAFAGFTGIVAALGQRSEGKWRPVDVIRFRALLEGSLAGLMFSVAPFGSYYFGVPESIAWRIGGGVLAVYIVALLFRTTRKQHRLGATSDPDFVHAARRLIFTLSFPAVATLTLNAAGVIQERTFAAYLLGLLLLLFLCSVMFVLLLRFVRTDA